MKISSFIFFIFFIACVTDAKENLSDKVTNKKDTIYGYFNNDTLKDYMIKKFSPDKINFDIYLKKQERFEKSFSSFYTSSIFSEEEFFLNSDLYNDNKGSITIAGFCCGNFKTVENYYYIYNDEVENWILHKEYTYSYNQDYSLNYSVSFPAQSISVDGLKFEQIKVKNEIEREVYFNNLLSNLLLTFSSAYKNKTSYPSLSDYPKFIILDMLHIVSVKSQNVVKYNDLAYYLQQTKSEDRNAEYILKEIINNFPERTVAYINLGDSYWDLKEYDSAKESYKIYVQLMKNTGKESMIPQMVLKRINE